MKNISKNRYIKYKMLSRLIKKPDMIRFLGNNNWPGQYDLPYPEYIENILIEEMIDIHSLENINWPVLYTGKLFIQNCDKNFIYYHLHKLRFPDCEELWINSHPDDIIPRIVEDFSTIFFTERTARLGKVERFYKQYLDKITIVSNDEFRKKLLEHNIYDWRKL